MSQTPADEASDATGSPVRYVCPSCRRVLEGEPKTDGVSIRRCPVHQLAYVDEREVPRDERNAFLGKTLVDRFVVLGRLGAGSMGAVYRARQEAFGRDVALKIVRRDRAYDPETKARFEREARALSALTSPHTVTVFDFGEADDGSWFLAMEMLIGESLGQCLRREGALPWRLAVHIAREALLSLAEAHQKGIVHRDLKPDNLFLVRRSGGSDDDSRPMCKVLDFGIAKLQQDDKKLDQLETQAGTVFGTPRYMSPEQAQGVELDARSDLYSLGVILFQMLSGRAPFVADDAVVVMAKHINEAPPRLAHVAPRAEVPAALERVVARALAKSPAARIQTAEQFMADLERASREAAASPKRSNETTTAALTPVERSLPPPRLPRHRLVVLGLGAATLFMAGAWLVSLWSHAPTAATVDRSAPLARGVTATMSQGLLEPVGSADAPVNTAAPANSASASPSASAASTRLSRPLPAASISSGPGTQHAAKSVDTVDTKGKHVGASVTRKTMEPKRPDERYGRFR
ncbi:MAG TPA: serine/threonine-protein kinase [Polyangiaceae bacterium]|nr:serine/threonine-protein kinase [Polyangiaceae bacterium]